MNIYIIGTQNDFTYQLHQNVVEACEILNIKPNVKFKSIYNTSSMLGVAIMPKLYIDNELVSENIILSVADLVEIFKKND